jgi:hypothetical protein
MRHEIRAWDFQQHGMLKAENLKQRIKVSFSLDGVLWLRGFFES